MPPSIQLGRHPLGQTMSKKVLYLTISLLTFLIFVYYTTDITATMTTTAPEENPINSFSDVLTSDIRDAIL